MSTGTKLSIIIPSAVFVIAAVAAAVLFALRGCEGITTPNNNDEGVAFPDEVFREYVLENFDSDGDGEISSSEAAAVTVINVDGMSIESLEGVGLFTELTELYCADNLISELDLSQNTKLLTLDCSSNALSELDISCTPQLVSLVCCYNSFSEINISGNDELLYLNINGQASMRISEKTFPDDNFREYVFKYPGTDNDRWLTPDEIESFDFIDVSSRQVESLEGIEYFTELRVLYCEENSISELDLSHNTKLTRLYCCYNELTSLDLSACTYLYYIDCSYNSLTEINFEGLDNIEEAHLDYNPLTSLSFDEGMAPMYLYCQGCCLESLDLSGSVMLTKLECQGNSLKTLDLSGSHDLVFVDCSTNEITEFNVAGDKNLTNIDCSHNKISELDLSDCEMLQQADCSDNELTLLNIKGLTWLNYLYCDENRLSELDLSGCPIILTLDCSENNLTALDVSQCVRLSELYCYGNSLDTVDVSENDNLTKMNAGGFTALRVCDKIFSDEIFMEYVSESIDSDGDGWLSEEECLSVTEIDVHDMGIESLDGLYCFTSLESLDCSGNQLETLELDEYENLLMLDCSDNNLAWLSVMNNRKLVALYCGNNQLEELDLCYILSSYRLSESYTEDEFSDDDTPKLEILSCEGNNLEWIEYIWENTNLWYINCSDNQLTSLDFWGENLKELYCSNNYLDSLWVTDSPLLEILDCSDNYLCELNLEYNSKLTELYCRGNLFTELDLSSNTVLEIYEVDENVTLYLPTSE